MGHRSWKTRAFLIFIVLLLLVPGITPKAALAASNPYSTKAVAGNGSIGGGGDGGPALEAQLSEPAGLWLDEASGAMYIADAYNHRIRKVDADGMISTVAGTGVAGFSGDGGSALSAQLSEPTDVLMDGGGNLYIADTMNNRIRKVDTSGNISTVAGTAGIGYNGDEKPATEAQLNMPTGLAMDAAGNLLIADSGNSRVRMVNTAGVISTIAGTDTPGYSGDGGLATNAKLNQPFHLAVDHDGLLYILDVGNQNARRIDSNGNISTLRGKNPNMPTMPAQLLDINVPQGIAVDRQGNVYVADSLNFNIRKLDSEGFVHTIKTESYAYGLKVGSDGAIYYADRAWHNQIFRTKLLSSDAGLTSVAGKTDAAPSGGAGSAPGDAVAWSVLVPNETSTIGLADIVPGDSASVKLYTDANFTAAVTGNGTIPLNEGAATGVYVKVTSEDGSAVKYYAVSVTRALAVSNDAGLTSVAGEVDGAPGGGNGASADEAITWAVNVSDSLSSVGLADIVPAAEASVKLYTGSDFTDKANGVVELTPGETTTLYIVVTAQDGMTNAFYAVAVYRPAPLSNDAGLVSVAGKTPASAPGGSGDAAGDPIIWSVNVPFSQASIGLADIAVASGASFKLYTDSMFSEEVTGAETIALTEAEATVAYVAVMAEDEATVKYYAVTVNRTAAPKDDNNDTPQTPAQPQSPASNAIEVYVNGKPERIGTATTTTVDDRKVSTVALDGKQLSDKLAAEGHGASVRMVSSTASDVVVARLTSNDLSKVREYDATLELKTGNASYTLPSQELDPSKLAASLGIDSDLTDMEIEIEIAESGVAKAKLAEDAAGKEGFSLVVPPIDFTVKIAAQGKTYEIKRFSAYVERTITLPEGINPSKITTGLVVEPNGTVRHVPTRVELIDGVYVAKINSLTNSTYALVWNPMTFPDVEGHWAKEAVNEMGSRMVVLGTDEKSFRPDADVTRAEFAAIVVRALGLKLGDGSNPFHDVDASDWYDSAVRTAFSYGLIAGFEDGTFRPNDNITREQAMTIIAKAIAVSGLKGKLKGQAADTTLARFADAASVAPWARNSVSETVAAGIVEGRNGATLDPAAKISRAEVAVIVWKLLVKSELI
ncbi:NHL domain-containing protein [Paenibacillus xylaniclasticus]|uniref:NHL domain-containing protein n=1 Tax=Paenibacillus xylaniclasticus TaxID=588083 RepID=UPI0013DF079D|nr:MULTISPECIES: S-layer homology domain-containing protein [Paenibacillus]GFN31344.1 hypothetical protein PCURB6_16040 [Paenibacillus curdlanolyticus]